MPEMTATVPMTWVAGSVRSAFEEFEVNVSSAKGFRCKACLKAYVVRSESELPSHDCTGSYDKAGKGPVTAL